MIHTNLFSKTVAWQIDKFHRSVSSMFIQLNTGEYIQILMCSIWITLYTDIAFKDGRCLFLLLWHICHHQSLYKGGPNHIDRLLVAGRPAAVPVVNPASSMLVDETWAKPKGDPLVLDVWWYKNVSSYLHFCTKWERGDTFIFTLSNYFFSFQSYSFHDFYSVLLSFPEWLLDWKLTHRITNIRCLELELWKILSKVSC